MTKTAGGINGLISQRHELHGMTDDRLRSRLLLAEYRKADALSLNNGSGWLLLADSFQGDIDAIKAILRLRAQPTQKRRDRPSHLNLNVARVAA